MDKEKQVTHNQDVSKTVPGGASSTRRITLLLITSDIISIALSFVLAFYLRKYAPIIPPPCSWP